MCHETRSPPNIPFFIHISDNRVLSHVTLLMSIWKPFTYSLKLNYLNEAAVMLVRK